jgi:hypothetical protein
VVVDGARSGRWGGGLITKCEYYDVIADIDWPIRDEFGEAPSIAGKQRARRFLEARPIAGHGRHEVIGSIARGALTIPVATRAAGIFYQLA